MKNDMKIKTFVLLAALSAGLVGCKNSAGDADTSGNEAYSFCLLDESKASGKLTVKLSDMVSGYEMVAFEDSDSALFKVRKPVVSENYVAIVQGGQGPVLLFDRKGRYVSRIGAIGGGPGEYRMSPYDALIDENRGVVYLAEMSSKSILEYGLDGKFVRSYEIGDLNKPALFMNADGSVSVASIAFADLGNPMTAATFYPGTDSVKRTVYPAMLTSFVDETGRAVGFNNEMWSFNNTANDVFMLTSNDTLYAYDYAANAVKPRAFLKEKAPKDKDSWYVATEIPQAILYSVVGPESRQLWYDKKTGELSEVTLINDYLGNSTFVFAGLRGGHFIQIWEPGMLADRIEEKWLVENEMTDEQRRQLEQLRDSLNPEGNSVMFIGKLK